MGKVAQMFKEIDNTIYQLDGFLHPSPPGIEPNSLSFLKILKITISVDLLIQGMIITPKAISSSLSILFNSASLGQKHFNNLLIHTTHFHMFLVP